MHGETGASGSSSHATSAVRAKEAVVSQTEFGSQDLSVQGGRTTLTVVDSKEKCDGNSAVAPSQAIHIHLHGCVDGRLGCSHGGIHGSRILDGSGISSSHQCVGNESRFQCVEGVEPQVTTSQSDSCCYRQYHSCLLHKQAGWDQIAPNGGSILGPLELVQEPRDHSRGSASSRGDECLSRPVIQEEPGSSHGVVSGSRSVQNSVSTDVQTSNRSVCYKAQSQAASVYIASPGSSSNRDRCVVRSGSLDRKGALRFSSSSFASSGSVKANDKFTSSNVTCGAALGNQDLLSISNASFSATTSEVASVTKTVEATSFAGLPSESSVTQSPRLLAQGRLSDEGFSGECIDRILNPFRDSTKAVYEGKWNRFINYCKERDLDANLITIPQLADFFLYLFTVLNQRPITIAGYRSALGPHLSHRLGDLGSNPVLSKLFKSFHRDRPKALSRVEPWDLSIVLYSLTQEPFEPLKTVPFKFLTWKTAFLIALGSGRRRSEIHAVKRENLYHTENWSRVTFQIDHFLCKNQQYDVSGDMFKSFTIPALCTEVDRNAKNERALCPIRALRYYLKRSSEEGKVQNRSALFVPLIDTKGELAKSSLSRWIKDCITFCLQSCSTENAEFHHIRAHDVRALASTWCLRGGVPLHDIMNACTWRNHTTFTKFYLKDSSISNNKGSFRLGPVVAAQSIVS